MEVLVIEIGIFFKLDETFSFSVSSFFFFILQKEYMSVDIW